MQQAMITRSASGYTIRTSNVLTNLPANILNKQNRMYCCYINIRSITYTVGADSIRVNTGWKNGGMRQLQDHIGRNLQMAVCLLHINELPLRHLITKLNGATSGAISFTGPIGRLLPCCHNLAIVDFKVIPNQQFPVLEASVVKDLSTDQLYLYKICKAVIDGAVPEKLGSEKCGPLNHSRWLTTASRLLRLYISDYQH